MSSTLGVLIAALVFSQFRGAWASLCSVSSLPGHDCACLSPIPPKQDPWYTEPAGFESAVPGSVLRIRSAPGNLTSSVANSSAVYNILYRTTDSHYLPTWAVTTLFVPREPDLKLVNDDGNGVLLSYQIAYDTANLDTSPSFTLYNDMPADIPSALGRGWYVSVPDYEGPLASFTAGVMSGHATLDGIRAASAAASLLGLSLLTRYAMWGYSGGALASEWAAELQVQYAPELRGLVGAVLGGLTPNITSVIYAVDKSQFAVLIPEGLIGLSSQYPAAWEYFLSQLKTDGPYNKTGFLNVRNQTLATATSRFLGQEIAQYFIRSDWSFLGARIMQQVINRDGVMGYHGVPTIPLFIHKAIGDELSPVEDTDMLVARYCAAGADILYQRNTVGGHGAEFTNGHDRVFKWLTDILSGRSNVTVGCSIQNVTVATSLLSI